MSTMASASLSDQQIALFREQGYLIVHGLLNAQQIAEIRDTFMEAGRNGPVEGLSEFRHGGRDAYSPTDPLSKYPRMMHPHLHMDKPVGPLARKYMLSPAIGQVLEDLMGEEPLAVQSMFYFKPPGARGQDLHQDNYYLRVSPGTCMAVWIAIDDADPDNGGMVLVPGTQDMQVVCPDKADPTKFFTTEHVDVPPGKKEVPAILKAGDVLFFNGSVIHGSDPNTSKDRFRRALICHYVPAGTRELSHWYRNPTRFNGQTLEIANATGGGPCGTVTEATAPH